MCLKNKPESTVLVCLSIKNGQLNEFLVSVQHSAQLSKKVELKSRACLSSNTSLLYVIQAWTFWMGDLSQSVSHGTLNTSVPLCISVQWSFWCWLKSLYQVYQKQGQVSIWAAGWQNADWYVDKNCFCNQYLFHRAWIRNGKHKCPCCARYTRLHINTSSILSSFQKKGLKASCAVVSLSAMDPTDTPSAEHSQYYYNF